MMQFIKEGIVIPFMKIKVFVEILCFAMVVGSIVSMAVKGLNWGLDFTGGIVVETEYSKAVDLETARSLPSGGY